VGKNSAYDIPSLRSTFLKDLEYGEQGEALVSSFLECISEGDFEVKSDRYRNGRMAVETDQNPRAALDEQGNPIWVKSGINLTKAKWWVYIFSPDGAFIVVSVDRLKKYLRANKRTFNESTKINFGKPDNPAKGFLLYPQHVQDLMTNPAFG
jgi:hypothetical protein